MPTLDKIKAIKIQKNNHQRKKHNIKSTRAHNCKFKSFFAAVLIVFLLSFPLLHHLISSFLFLHMRTISFIWKSIRIKFPFKNCRLLMKTERKEDSHCCVRVKILEKVIYVHTVHFPFGTKRSLGWRGSYRNLKSNATKNWLETWRH